MNKLSRLSKEDIEKSYLRKPILIKCKDNKDWYIIRDVFSSMPLHLLTVKESGLYNKDKESILGIEVVGIEGKGYLMWIYFDKVDGWSAYGYD